MLNTKQILNNPLPFHKKNFEKHGDTFEISTLGDGKLIFSKDPIVVKEVLQKKQKSFAKSKLQTKDLAKYIGFGLLTAEGEHWRTHRRMIQPAFHLKSLKKLLNIMAGSIKNTLSNAIEIGDEKDIFPLMSDLAFQVVAKSLFSSLKVLKPMADLKEITEKNQTMLIREMRQPYLKWWFKASGEIKRHIEYADDARAILNEVIEERIASVTNEDDLLQMLLDATYEDGSNMSRKQLIDEILILFTAGHETTANALAFVLYYIAKDSELQDKLYKETKKLKEDTYTMDSFKELELISSTVQEAMRMYPPAYIIDRVALEETEIGGFKFKKGALVLLSLYELHRHQDFWDKPETFIGSRFKDFKDKNYTNYYYPFGAGPRMCIGNAFATYEMLLVVVEVLKKYQISTSMDKVVINPMITLRPKEVSLQFNLR